MCVSAEVRNISREEPTTKKDKENQASTEQFHIIIVILDFYIHYYTTYNIQQKAEQMHTTYVSYVPMGKIKAT